MDNVAQLETDTDFQGRKKITWAVFAALLLFLLIGILYYFFVYRFYQSTDNAYVQADVTWVMPKISGEVVDLIIQDNQVVKKGEALAILDHRDYQARYDQAQSVVTLKKAALDVQQQNERSAKSTISEANSGVIAAQAMAIIPEGSLYVEANFKETQIEKMHIGQKVKLKIDAYPSLTYTGKIESFSPASGATFSMMPPDNATGNFNKVVQRIPVRIAIDSSPHIDLIKPGMSVNATVDLKT